MLSINEKLAAELYRRANAEQWRVSRQRFGQALETSAAKAFTGTTPGRREVAHYLSTLHLEELALACACADGDNDAWDHFVLQHRPVLYRAADALDPSGGARDIADALYADLFGLRDGVEERQSLFRYFHGRSSLATWLRAVLAQRHVDRIRASRRSETLPDDDSVLSSLTAAKSIDPDREHFLILIRHALERAIARLVPRDRFRLACYYAQDLTLAQTGKLLAEHEATVSRGLTRTRKEIREAVEIELRERERLSEAEIARCFECVIEDAGPLDLRDMLGTDGGDRVQETGSRSFSIRGKP